MSEYQAGRFADATPIRGPPAGRPFKLEPGDRVYVEVGVDQPGLHGTDPPAAIKSAVAELIGRKAGAVVELPRADVAHTTRPGSVRAPPNTAG